MATTPVFLPGKSHGLRSLAGYSPWGHKESDMTEQLHLQGKISCKITGTKTKGIKIGGNNLHQEKETVPETKQSHRKRCDFAVNNSYAVFLLHVDLSTNGKTTTEGRWKGGQRTEKVSVQDGIVLAYCGRSAKRNFQNQVNRQDQRAQREVLKVTVVRRWGEWGWYCCFA